MKIVDMKLGTEGELDIELQSGVVVIALTEEMVGMPGGLQLKVPLKYYLDAMAAKAANPFVSGVVAVIESTLNAIP